MPERWVLRSFRERPAPTMADMTVQPRFTGYGPATIGVEMKAASAKQRRTIP